MKAIKLFLISNMYPSKVNPGFGVFVKNFKVNQEERGVQFPYVSVINQKAKGIVNKFEIYFKHYINIFKNFFKKDYDIIYIHFISHNAPIFLFLLTFFKKKKPIVVNVHGSDIIKYNSGFLGFCNSFLLRRTDLVVVPSTFFLEIMLTKFPFLNLKNIFVSPSGGIDSSVFYPTNYNCVKKSEILRVGFVSRIDKGKGWDVFLESLFILKSKGIIFSAVIAGNGAQVEIMKDEIKSLRLTDDVLYLGGLKQEELRIVYNDIDIFVFSSKEVESLGLVGIEAMSCGIPIIACDSAGPKTYVNDNINSFLVKPGSSSEVAEALIKFKNMSLLEKDKIKREALNTAKLFNSILVGDSLCAKLTTLCIK